MADINVTLAISSGITVDVAVGTGGGGVGTDELVKYNAADAAAGYLGAKVVAGLGISLAEGIGADADKLVITSTAVGAGDVIGPAANTPDYLPQWNGLNTKTLKNGLAVPAGGLAGITALNLKTELQTVLDSDELEFALIKSYMI